MAHLPSVAGVKVWKARTGFRLIKYVLHQWECGCVRTRRKDPSQHALQSHSVDVSLVWWPGKQQHTVRGSGFLEVIDTGIHTDNGQQVAIDYNINFISNRHDL